jgi:hypothetical protein
MRTAAVLGLVLAISCAQGAEPKLTKELLEKIRAGADKLTEDDVLKLVPGPVDVAAAGDPTEWRLIWEEAISINVLLIDGKVFSANAHFDDTVTSKTLTRDAFKRIKTGMKREEVEMSLGRPNSESSLVDNMRQLHTNCRWSQGRRLFVQIKDGKVIGCGFMEGGLP